MAKLGEENFFWHKLHSLTGIIPVGYYLVQHLTLNTFSLGGREKFNGVIAFFEGMPTHFLIALKIFAIWLPLIFHAVYGLFIVNRASPNLSEKAYRWRENRYYTWQRASGILAFLFLIYHMTTTSVAGKVKGVQVIQYDAWAGKLSEPVLGIPYLILAVYMLGILACTYHFSYGLWSFCIRWGLTINENAQASLWRLANVSFIGLTLLGYLALLGFFWAPFSESHQSDGPVQVQLEHSRPISTSP
jgi:succinate dehydrogenase / fumarate reductase cytochrome b subunit